MKPYIRTAGIACLAFAALSVHAGAQESARKIRVGVYDNRAIAMAFFRSNHNPFVDRRAEFQSAQEAGDSARIQELNAWVERFQRQLHFQGFCRAPVDDLLLYVKDKLPGVMGRHDLDLIGWYPDLAGPHVEVIDITSELAALFEPTPETLQRIEELKDIEPTALADITHEH